MKFNNVLYSEMRSPKCTCVTLNVMYIFTLVQLVRGPLHWSQVRSLPVSKSKSKSKSFGGFTMLRFTAKYLQITEK